MEICLNPQKATILVADDDEDIRLALELLLMAEGYQVIEAGNAKDVMFKANHQQPDLILLDMNFSRDTTSGQEGLDILSQLKPYNIPVILMTAWGSIELAVKGLQQGANDFVEKPWNKLKLLNSIKHNSAFPASKTNTKAIVNYWLRKRLSPGFVSPKACLISNNSSNKSRLLTPMCSFWARMAQVSHY